MSDQEQNNSDIILYSTPDGNIRVDVLFEEETFWLTQKRMGELFGVEVNTTTTTSKRSMRQESFKKKENARSTDLWICTT
jgi:hypothetical protein